MVSVVIAAAGFGQRMGGTVNKQYLLLGGLPVIGRTLSVFAGLAEVSEIILVVRVDELSFAAAAIEAFGAAKTKLVPGGATRQESVRLGLNAVSTKSGIVVIHDGARPLVQQGLVRQVIAAAEEYQAAIAAVPVKDTIKIGANGFVSETLDRGKLWAIQTPQAFERELILKAHEQGIRVEATDDATLVERLGHAVKIVPGSYQNIKITTPEDLILAEALLKEDMPHAGRYRV